MTALKESNLSIPENAHTALSQARQRFAKSQFGEWRASLSEANEAFSTANTPVPLCFLEGDLEWAMFSGLSSTACKRLATCLGIAFGDKDAFVKRMGSKAIDSRGGEAYKAPYLRK